jgi:hypothetical protein
VARNLARGLQVKSRHVRYTAEPPCNVWVFYLLSLSVFNSLSIRGSGVNNMWSLVQGRSYLWDKRMMTN